jgi:hypothetical protein
MGISTQIKDEIVKGGTGKLYVIGDFSKYLNDNLVAQVLVRLEKSGLLIRISQGIYLYPERNRFGIVYPSLHTIANTIAERDKTTILPSGATALNELGISTQVPTNAVYLTTGSSRTVKIDNRTIVFKKGVPRYFSYKSNLMPLIVLSFKELGEKNIDDEVIHVVTAIINNSHEKELIKEDLAIAPIWIKKILLLIVKQI